MEAKPDHRHAALVVAAAATAGSLYFSLGMGLVPCDLCWYQRILMYPLVVFIGVGLLRGDALAPYVLPMSVGGFAVAVYHNYLQMTPATGACTSEVPCSVVQYSFHGVTIPQMSLTAFGMITALFLLPVVVGGRTR
jgi:disulfide bond formation protein DsbB